MYGPEKLQSGGFVVNLNFFFSYSLEIARSLTLELHARTSILVRPQCPHIPVITNTTAAATATTTTTVVVIIIIVIIINRRRHNNNK